MLSSWIHSTAYTLEAIAGLTCVGFLIYGGFLLMASRGAPDKLLHAKHIIKNTLIGLLIVLGATLISSVLIHAYTPPHTSVQALPSLKPIKTTQPTDLVSILINSIGSLIKTIIESAAVPFIHGLSYFTSSTPYMTNTASVFNLWLVIVAIADSLFILAIIILGMHIMSASVIGLQEFDIRHVLPQIIVTFLCMNASIFMIDGLISLSNAMVSTVEVTAPIASVWKSLEDVVSASGSFQLAALLILLVFMVLSVMLIIYYLLRIVTLYIGAVLSPLVILLWLLPPFKPFVYGAIRSYLITIFVLFIHVTILALAASIFLGLAHATPAHILDPVMAGLVGIATLLALLKSQSVVSHLASASSSLHALRQLGGQFVNGVSFISSRNRGEE